MDSRVDKMKLLRKKNVSLREIGSKFGVSRERVRQLIGNTGRFAGVKQLSLNLDYWRAQAYLAQVPLEEIAKKFRLSVVTVKQILGSENNYLKSIGKHRCHECGIRNIEDFYVLKNGSLFSLCKDCSGDRTREWIENNRERFNETHRVLQRTPKYRKYAKKWRKQRWDSDPTFREELKRRSKKYYRDNRVEILKRAREKYKAERS